MFENDATAVTREQRSLRRHDRLSSEWSEKYYGRKFPRNMDEYDIWKRHRLFLKYLARIGPVERAIEIGCGTGDNIACCRARVRDGIDVSEKMIEEARRRYPGVNFSVADAMAGNLGNSYDLVVALGVIQYVADHRRFLDAVADLLRKGGHLVLSFPNRRSLFRKLHYAQTGADLIGQQIDHDKDEMIDELRRRGLSAVCLAAHSSALPDGGRLAAPLWLASTFIFDGLYALPAFGSLANWLAYSYLGVFSRSG